MNCRFEPARRQRGSVVISLGASDVIFSREEMFIPLDSGRALIIKVAYVLPRGENVTDYR